MDVRRGFRRDNEKININKSYKGQDVRENHDHRRIILPFKQSYQKYLMSNIGLQLRNLSLFALE